MTEPTMPLTGWRFTGRLRTHQEQVLTRFPPGTQTELHIVAPPGSGKTLLGLLLAAREGRRALVLAPSTTIREQWARTAATLAPDRAAMSTGSVSTDPHRIADLTALTYQMLSVTGDGSPFDALARARWADELVRAGRTQSAAETWLAELAVDNAGQYRSGLARRVRRIRRRFTRERPDEIAKVLHPNAVASVQRIVDAGVDTVVLDECHHLLDHWALVVAYLVGAIRERGGRGLVIGLTATLPDRADGTEFENYTQLLGDVDFEVPVPAVVKEGHLAPYRDFVWFTEPTHAEAAFIRRHGQELDALLTQVLSTPDGIRYLEECLQPQDRQTAKADADHGGPGESGPSAAALERALAEDLALTRSCGLVLRALVPDHPICTILPPVLFDRCTTDDLLTVMARFALTRLLPDPAAKHQWRFVRSALADFGLRLTDRGLRRGRDPVETTLAFSEAKDRAAADILRLELDGADGERVNAVIVTDFVEHGNSRGLVGRSAAGAVRAYDVVVGDLVTATLNPVLLTADCIRVPAARAAEFAAAISDHVGSPVRVRPDGHGPWRELDTGGIGAGRLVGAVSSLMSARAVRLLVGTRGLLGEGWDCPAVNTLIDLTTVTTATGASQLRGRSLRKDPAWPDKVAHNWSVTCLIPPHVAVDDTAEPRRLARRHGHLLGLSADDDGRIVRGLGNALSRRARVALDGVLRKDPTASLGQLQTAVRDDLRPRSATRAAWRIGEPFAAAERETLTLRTSSTAALIPTARTVGAALPWAVLLGAACTGAVTAVAAGFVPMTPIAGTGIAVAAGTALAVAGAAAPLSRDRRRRRDPAVLFRGAAVAVARTLAEAGRIRPIDEESIVARVEGDRVRVELAGPDQRVIADALEELFAAPAAPRFLLRTDRADVGGRFSLIGAVAALRSRGLRGAAFLAVPRLIARRRADAEAFARHWTQQVGAGQLIELQGEQGLALLALARSTPRVLDDVEPRMMVWG